MSLLASQFTSHIRVAMLVATLIEAGVRFDCVTSSANKLEAVTITTVAEIQIIGPMTGAAFFPLE